MAIVGLTLVLASISLFFYRPQAFTAVTRFWEEAKGQFKDLPQIRTKGARNKPSRDSNGTQKDRSSQLKMTPPSSPKANDKAVIASGTTNSPVKAEPSAPRAADHNPPPARPLSTSRSQHDVSAAQSNSSDAKLMPPPPRPTPKPARPPTTTSALRVPTTGPLPNRGPPSSSSLSNGPSTLTPSSTATASTLPAALRPRKKVLLAPGHSPLDWADKTRSSSSQALSGVPYPQRITPSQLARATGRHGKPAWSAYKGRVYNIGPYLPFHPGGEPELMRAAGRDGQRLFDEVHAWVNWENMLDSCFVGWLVSEEAVAAAEAEGSEDLEGLD